MTVASGPPANPYIGPRAFGPGERLYGREREANQLLNLVIAERIVLLHSPSGAGKTSLIQAALIPALLKRKFRVLPVVRVNHAPSASPNGHAESNRYLVSALLSLETGLPVDRQMPADLLTRTNFSDYMAQRPKPTDGTVEVLIFDQFEEILTLNPVDQDAKREFFAQLGEVLGEPRRWALFSMREDFVAALDPYVLPIPGRFNTKFRLDLLTPSAARLAMQQPALQSGVEFEDAAAEKLADDLRRVRVQQPDGTLEPRLGPYVEPVQLQVVCQRLWDQPRPEGQRITLQDLTALGPVDQSLVDQSLSDYYAQRVAAAAAATGVSERTIREWFDRRLITEQGVRGTVLMGKDRSGDLDNRVIRLLVDAYLVRGEQRGGATWFELSHDRLLAPLRANNTAWFKANLNLMQVQADLWVQRGRPESLLLRGQELNQALQWAEQHPAELLPAEADFLANSREQQARTLRLKRRDQVISVLGLVAILLAVLALLAFRQATLQRENAERQARVARAQELAAQSQNALTEFPPRSMLLAIEALRVSSQANEPRQVAAEDALRTAIKDPHGSLLRGHQDQVNALAYSRDGRWLATGSADQTVRVWDMRAADPAANPLVLGGRIGQINSIAFSADGRWLAAAGKDSTARLWDMRAADPAAAPILLPTQDTELFAIAISPDSRWLAIGSLDGIVRLWDIRAPRSGAAPILLRGHQDLVFVLAFSPDGHWLATGSDDHEARLWDLRSSNPAANSLRLQGHVGLIRAVAFSPDGHWFATGSRDKTARLWDLTGPNPSANPMVLGGHRDWVNALAFSPDGHWLATASGDRTAQLWDLRGPLDRAVVLHGHAQPVNTLAFSPDSRRLATGGADKTAWLWDLDSRDPSADPLVLRGHEDQIRALDFSPDGHQLATGSADHTARLWLVNAVDPAVNPIVHNDSQEQINAVAISPDGRWLAAGGGDSATGGKDNAVRLFDLTAGPMAAPILLTGHEKWVQVLAFSPDGQWLATGSGDNTARVWNMRAADPALQPLVLRGHTNFIYALAFSPDGRWLATGSRDKTARLWDLRAENPAASPIVLNGHTEQVSILAFSPDGRWLATGSRDHTVRLWDLRAADPAAQSIVLSDHQDWVNALSYSPDGQWLATGSDDMSVRLWNLRAADLAGSARVLASRQDPVTVLAFSPDGRWLAGGGRNKTVRVWDLRAADPAANPLVLAGHDAQINTLAFSSNGQWLATGSDDKTVRLWDMTAANVAAAPIILRGHAQGITTLAFSPDNRQLITGSKDHTVRLWLLPLEDLIRLACHSAGRNFTQEEWRLFFSDEGYHKTCAEWP